MTLSQLINNHFMLKAIKRSKPQLSKCRSCGDDLPQQQQIVFAGYPPHILFLVVNVKKQDSLPNWSNWKEVQDGFRFEFEMVKVRYR